MKVYRAQGRSASWFDNITESNVADAAGEACFLANFDVERVFPAHPIVSAYVVEFFLPFDRYAECPECFTKPCASEAPPRACTYPPKATRTKVGNESCTTPSGVGPGSWFSLPTLGVCKKPRDAVGTDCFWKVLYMEKSVSIACLRTHGCAKGDCDEAKFSQAFAICDDLSLPMKCTECPMANGMLDSSCTQLHPEVTEWVTSSKICDDTQAPRFRFAPSDCFACLANGSTWVIAGGLQPSSRPFFTQFHYCSPKPLSWPDWGVVTPSQCAAAYGTNS